MPARRAASVIVAGVLGAAILAASAYADTYRVTRTGDPAPGPCTQNHCSLREAVRAANASIGVGDRIVLPNRRRPYRLTRVGTDEGAALDGDLDVANGRLVITHRGRGRATINASAVSERVLDAFSPMVLKKLVLAGGEQSGNENGGAIETEADLRISRSVLRNNQTEDFGGAISQGVGDLTIERSAFIGNVALDEAGAINAAGGRTVIRRSTFRGNRALASQGGAIYASTELLIERSTFVANRTVSRGGALHIDGGEATIRSSTFSENRAEENGGAVNSNSGNAEIVNSTFSGNRAHGHGGAIWNGGNVVVNAVTIARNVSNSDNDLVGAGGGIFNNGGAVVEIANSVIVLNDQRGGDGDDCSGSFASSGGNLRTDGTDCSGFDEAGDAIRARPRIEGLRRNGGPTKTIALKRGSPAIGRAIEASAPARDQRGRRRDGNPDSGAYERGA